jgi:hypothetical protein
MTMDYYLDELDIPMVNNAVNIMCKSPHYNKEIDHWIWEKKRTPFEVFD